ncbi:MAG: YicC/YloC family endoribonuclease [Candidatus Metalachnospira sp.]|nr:YicC/YloC family endoribonuclease [Candidatus Metalachnospira sp.]
MIKSMTGYGRGENESDNRKFSVEIKSVNHRYNDISIRLPRSMNYLEDKIRKILMKKIMRGKTDVYITFETFSNDDINIKINEPLAKAYCEKLDYLKLYYGLTGDNILDLVAKFPDVITVEKVQEDEDTVWNALLPALEGAIDSFVSMREAEGESLKEDVLKKTEFIEEYVSKIKERAPFVAEDYRKRLTDRLNELLADTNIDEQRILTEVTVFADRACIDEEITRLGSHINQLRDIFCKDESIGRKLDFLIQEMNREANTIASKSNDIRITQITIELKSEIEKIREQIQNIE